MSAESEGALDRRAGLYVNDKTGCDECCSRPRSSVLQQVHQSRGRLTRRVETYS